MTCTYLGYRYCTLPSLLILQHQGSIILASGILFLEHEGHGKAVVLSLVGRSKVLFALLQHSQSELFYVRHHGGPWCHSPSRALWPEFVNSSRKVARELGIESVMVLLFGDAAFSTSREGAPCCVSANATGREYHEEARVGNL